MNQIARRIMPGPAGLAKPQGGPLAASPPVVAPFDVLGGGTVAGGPLPQPSPWRMHGSYIDYVTGGVVIGQPVGGDMGQGALNTAGFFINGQPITAVPAPQASQALEFMRVNVTGSGYEAFAEWTVNEQTGSYTLVLNDAWCVVRYTNTIPGTILVPLNAAVPFPIGTVIKLTQGSTGWLVAAAQAGVVINAPGGLMFNSQYLTAELRKSGTDQWSLDFEGVPATPNVPVYAQQNVAGAVTLDRNRGEIQRLRLTGNVSAFTIQNWPGPGTLGRLVLDVVNAGSFIVNWIGTVWPSGITPIVTVNGHDVFILTSFDGGATIMGTVVGQNYH